MVVNEKEILAAKVIERRVKFRGRERIEYVLYRERTPLRDSYSVQAIQFKHGHKICQATCRDVACDRVDASGVFDVISEGYVEPYVLSDVVYDLLP